MSGTEPWDPGSAHCGPLMPALTRPLIGSQHPLPRSDWLNLVKLASYWLRGLMRIPDWLTADADWSLHDSLQCHHHQANIPQSSQEIRHTQEFKRAPMIKIKSKHKCTFD